MPPDSRILYNESAPSHKLARHGILAIVYDIQQSNSMVWPSKRIPYQPSNLGTAIGASKKRSAAGLPPQARLVLKRQLLHAIAY